MKPIHRLLRYLLRHLRLCPPLRQPVRPPRPMLAASLLLAAGCAAAVEAAPPAVDARAYLVELNGRPHWQRAADTPLPPASLTKLMTALLVLEDGDPDRLVTVSTAAARQQGTRIGLRAGERYTVTDLLAAALVASANDACEALAENGDTRAFVQRMNRRAAALGLKHTHFRNACGFDARGHVSTARELAVIARAALRFPEFARTVALPRITIRPAGGTRVLSAASTNALIGNYAPAAGVKTGYTTQAGPCLIALGRQHGAEVLLVMLNARNRWWDAIGLFEHGFGDAQRAARAHAAAR